MWCDKLACILPFEEEWFRSRGVEAVFVGNPLLDELDESLWQKRRVQRFRSVAGEDACFGSRSGDSEAVAMQKIAMGLQASWPQIQFVVSALTRSGADADG